MGPGSRVGGYELLEELARGGMGAVYRARDPRSGQEVALKLLLRGRAAPPEQRRRFEREARALGRLRHPYVVGVLDAGEDAGLPWLAMELVPGEALSRRLQREGPLAPAQAVAIVRKLAQALEHAHAQGLLHRDIKPHNVLLRPDGAPVLTDFGLTREVDPEAGGALTRTRGGQFLGTPGYWAPEQAHGRAEQVGPRSDVYGLGALLVALLTGAPPQPLGSSLPELLAAVDQPPRPPSGQRPEVDPALDAICLRALAVDPAARHPDAAALAADLAAWEHGLLVPRRRASWRAAWAAGALAGVLAGAILGALGTLLVVSRRPPRLAASDPRAAAPASATPAAPGTRAAPGPVS